MRTIFIVVVFSILLGNWYYFIDETEFYVKTVTISIDIEEAYRILIPPIYNDNDYYYVDTITYEKKRTLIPFVFKKDTVTRSGRKYFSKGSKNLYYAKNK